MSVPYPSEAVGNAHVSISHAHIHYGRLLTYLMTHFETSYIPEVK